MPECAVPPRCEFVHDGRPCPHRALPGTHPRRCGLHATAEGPKSLSEPTKPA